MAIHFNLDGSVIFVSENGDGAVQTITAGTPQSTWGPQYTTFIAAHGAPVVQVQSGLVVIPNTNPGVTGALWLNSSTLNISLGSGGTQQIGGTGPTGGVSVI
jgi:hypothetical protein